MCCLVACCAVYYLRCRRLEGGERYIVAAIADVETHPSSAVVIVSKVEETASDAVALKPVTPPLPEDDVWEGLLDDADGAAAVPVTAAGFEKVSSVTDASLPSVTILALPPQELGGELQIDAVAQGDLNDDAFAPEHALSTVRSERSHVSSSVAEVADGPLLSSSAKGSSSGDAVTATIADAAPTPLSEAIHFPDEPFAPPFPVERGPVWLPGTRKLVADTLASPGHRSTFRTSSETGPRSSGDVLRRTTSTRRVAPGRRQALAAASASGLEFLPPLPLTEGPVGLLTRGELLQGPAAGHPHEVAEDIEALSAALSGGPAPAAAAEAVVSSPDADNAAETRTSPPGVGDDSYASTAASPAAAAPLDNTPHAASPNKLPLHTVVAAEKLVAELMRVRTAGSDVGEGVLGIARLSSLPCPPPSGCRLAP